MKFVHKDTTRPFREANKLVGGHSTEGDDHCYAHCSYNNVIFSFITRLRPINGFTAIDLRKYSNRLRSIF